MLNKTHRPSVTTARNYLHGFTIVELLIVVVVIAILAAIVIVAYNGIIAQSTVAVLKSDVHNAQTKLDALYVETGAYPVDATNLPFSSDTYYEYDGSDDAYCLTASSVKARINFYISNTVRTITEGVCSGHLGYVADGDGNNESPICAARPYSTLDSAGWIAWARELPPATCHTLDLWFYKQGDDPSTAEKRGELTIVSGVLSNSDRNVTLSFRADKLGIWETGKTYYGSPNTGGIFSIYCASATTASSHSSTHFASVGSPSGYAWGQTKTATWSCVSGRTPIVFGFSGGATEQMVGVLWGPGGIWTP